MTWRSRAHSPSGPGRGRLRSSRTAFRAARRGPCSTSLRFRCGPHWPSFAVETSGECVAGAGSFRPPAPAAVCRISSVEHQDGAGHLTSFHRAKRFVNIFQTTAARDHFVEFEPSLEIEVDVAWHVLAETVRAHRRALDLLFREERWAIELDFGAHGDHADDRGRAAGRKHFERLLGGALVADGFKRVF